MSLTIITILIAIILLGLLIYVLVKKVSKVSFKSFSFEIFKVFKANVETHPTPKEIVEDFKNKNPLEYEKLQQSTEEKSKEFNWDRKNIFVSDLKNPTTGYKHIDSIINFFAPSSLIIVAGNTCSGKTSLIINFSNNNLNKGIPVLFFSYECSSSQIIDKTLANETRISKGDIKLSKISSDRDFVRVRDSLERINKFPLFINDNVENTLNIIEQRAMSFSKEFPNGLIIIDSLELIYPEKNYSNQSEKTNDYIISLKRIARKSEMPILVTCQIAGSYNIRGGRPRLSDIREVGNADHISDVVMFLHGSSTFGEFSGLVELCVEKNRNGDTGRAEIYFDKHTDSFLNLEKGTLLKDSSFDDF